MKQGKENGNTVTRQQLGKGKETVCVLARACCCGKENGVFL